MAPAGTCERLQMLRLDLLHPIVSGNKWYKLRYNVEEAIARGKSTLLTFGGGYSNHLVATAFAARQNGLHSVGVVRGHYASGHVTPTLRACESYGMQLLSLTKAQYAESASAAGLQALAQQFPDALIVPEGGANDAGIRGAGEIAALIPDDATDVCMAVGTGTTMTGLHASLPRNTSLHGFCAAQSCDTARALIESRPARNSLHIHSVSDPRFGKWTDELLLFIRSFYQSTGIPLDIVYTAKMMHALQDLLTKNSFGPHRKIVCIHTGGLQGNQPGLFA